MFGKYEFLQIVTESGIIVMSKRQKLIYIIRSPIIGLEIKSHFDDLLQKSYKNTNILQKYIHTHRITKI